MVMPERMLRKSLKEHVCLKYNKEKHRLSCDALV